MTTNNLLVSFELHSPASNYHAVEDAVAGLGRGIRIHTFFWYVKSQLDARKAAEKLWTVMDERDSVIVVDASRGEAGWKHISFDAAEFVKTLWHSEGLPAPARAQDSALLRPRQPRKEFER